MSRTRHHRYKCKFVATDKLKKICELKRDKQGLQAGKVNDRIPVDPGAKIKTETKPKYVPRKMVLKLKLDSRLV